MLVPELPRPTKALDISTMAFCMASLGRRNDDLVMLKNSLGLYVRGFHEVQRALWDPQLIYRDETLAACMALAIYEQFECPAANRRAHASHHDGIVKLIELRGAEAHSYGLAHQIFLAFRTHNICYFLYLKAFLPKLMTLEDLAGSKTASVDISLELDLVLRTLGLDSQNLYRRGFGLVFHRTRDFRTSV